MLKSILVTGKNGQLGRSLQKVANDYPQYEFTFVGREELDLSQSQSIPRYFEDKQFDVILNCAAYTAVDRAESEPELADQINHKAVEQMAQIAKIQNSLLVHISTDYVFNGQNYKPYTENDSTDPKNVYGLTKLEGENAVLLIDPSAIIIRTSWVYSEFGNNFVKTMLRLGKEKESLNVISDQVGTPTYAGDLAIAILDIIESQPAQPGTSGKSMELKEKGVSIYHFSNAGVCSWYDFAKAIFELGNISCAVNPIETIDYPTPAKRPYYSVLNKAKISKINNMKISFWKSSLADCLKLLGEYR